MPRRNVTGTGSGFERRARDYSICVLKLWSSEISGPRTSPHYRKTLICSVTELKPLTYENGKQLKLLSMDIRPILIRWTPRSKLTFVSAIIAKRQTELSCPPLHFTFTLAYVGLHAMTGSCSQVRNAGRIRMMNYRRLNTSSMSYRPGGCWTTHRAARKAPPAKVSRLLARCVTSMRSPIPPKRIVWSPTMSPARMV
jgi:hypothetical protein